MADYYPLIARAVSSLAINTSETRQALYERARTVLVAQLRGQDPPVSMSDIARERSALEAAIRRVDAEWPSPGYATRPDSAKQVVPQQAAYRTTTPRVNLPSAALNKERVSADEPTQITRTEPTKPDRKLASNLRPITANALKTFSMFMLGIACFAVLALIPVIYILGLAWVSEHVVEYLALPVSVALVLCVFIFIPLALFRKTRFVSIYGFLISSYLFGFTTWVLGFLTTLQYWGTIGVFIGLFLGIVGVVPLGITAAAFHSDWSSVVALIVGLAVTYGARMIGFGLAASLER